MTTFNYFYQTLFFFFFFNILICNLKNTKIFMSSLSLLISYITLHWGGFKNVIVCNFDYVICNCLLICFLFGYVIWLSTILYSPCAGSTSFTHKKVEWLIKIQQWNFERTIDRELCMRIMMIAYIIIEFEFVTHTIYKLFHMRVKTYQTMDWELIV